MKNLNTVCQKLSDTMKEVLRMGPVALSAHWKISEKSQINNLLMYINKNKPDPKIIDVKNIEEWGRNQWNRNGKNWLNQIWFFEMVEKIGKPLAKLVKRERDYTQIKTTYRGGKHNKCQITLESHKNIPVIPITWNWKIHKVKV